MNGERGRHLAEHFERVHTLGDEARAEYLDKLRAREPSLVDDLEELLRQDEQGGPIPTDPTVSLISFESVEQKSGVAKVVADLAARSPPSTRYDIYGEHARGGMGAILRASDKNLRRGLAMKVILGSESSGVGARQLARFLDEAQITGQLEHPGVVPVHELGVDGQGHVYFTMRFVKGRTLHEVFELVRGSDASWSQTRVLSILLRVCETLAYAHSKDVIHRDLKPANIMVGRFGEVYVMDWGIARVLGRPDHGDPCSDALRQSGSTIPLEVDSPFVSGGDRVGTPPYTPPPECLSGDNESIGPQYDVFSLGVMLYELIGGLTPYDNAAGKGGPRAVFASILEGPPKPLHTIDATAPAELVAICEKAMERDVSRRYRNMMELKEDLAAFLEGRVVSAYETGAFAELKKWVQRNRALAAAVGVALTLLVVGLGFALFLRQEALENAALAERKEGEAKEQERIANKRAADILSLSAFQKLEDLETEAANLWPPHHEHLVAYDRWIADAGELVDGLDPDPVAGDVGHRARLAELRERSRPMSQAHYEATVTKAQGKGLAKFEWEFADRSDRWWHNQLSKLVVMIEVFADPETGIWKGTSSDHGWGIVRRRTFASTVEERTVSGIEVAALWEAAIQRVAVNPKYAGVSLVPQLGLVPLGPDSSSSLEEFGHPLTGTLPERDSDGALVLGEEVGLVFVLLPGADFWMGAQSSDPNGRNFDPQAKSNEGPVHRVTLTAFFLSKYELTQGQWERFAGRNPSYYQPPDSLAPSLLHPVEQVNWRTSREVCVRMGLTLPTEAQWEYGARGGTSTAWWTGENRESLRTNNAANLADQSAARADVPAEHKHWPGVDDGSAAHAPVDSYTPNPFGLYNVHGNVWEWCLDGYGEYTEGVGSDPMTDPSSSPRRVYRGGSFDTPAARMRVAYRIDSTPESAYRGLGLRPARALLGQ